jgi:hypothetical protein
MLKRIIEIIVGMAIALSLFASYSDDTHESRLVIWYLFTPKVLQVIVWIVLFLIASRLVYGKYKDYSKYFYTLFTRIFGDPKKSDRQG